MEKITKQFIDQQKKPIEKLTQVKTGNENFEDTFFEELEQFQEIIPRYKEISTILSIQSQKTIVSSNLLWTFWLQKMKVRWLLLILIATELQ